MKVIRFVCISFVGVPATCVPLGDLFDDISLQFVSPKGPQVASSETAATPHDQSFSAYVLSVLADGYCTAVLELQRPIICSVR